VAAGVEAEAAMNPVLLKPTGDRNSQVIVMGQPYAVLSASESPARKEELRPVVLDAVADLRSRFDVVLCEGAGGAAEINLLRRDLANLPLAAATGFPAVIVGDIDRGGVFASLYGTVALLPDDLRRCVHGFVVNRLRGDPALLFDACAELEERSGVSTLGVVPMIEGTDLDAEDSLALDHWTTTASTSVSALDVAVIRFPRISNFGDLDPLRIEPGVAVRWVRSAAELGRPQLIVMPGSKATRDDLQWFRATGLADAVESSGASIVCICAGVQMAGGRIDDQLGVEGFAGISEGLGWLPLTTTFEGDKVLDRPRGTATAGPGAGAAVTGYRIHHGRVAADDSAARPWLVDDDGAPLGWFSDRVLGTTLHALFENDRLRRAILGWAASRSGQTPPVARPFSFADAREARIDRIADTLEANLDLDRVFALIERGAGES
jgi:adenosylcobyric acid synthase